MGFDGSGMIIAKGPRANKFEIGDDIFVRASRSYKGTFARHILLSEDIAAIKPVNLSYQEAASLPLVALTTIQALEYAEARSGQHLFINAGAGGIGSFAIQYAKTLDLEVTVQCHRRDKAFLQSFGPDHFIFYNEENYLDSGPIFDIVYDCLGKDHTIFSFTTIKKGGTVVSIAGPPDKYFAKREKLGLAAKIFMWTMNRKVYAAAKKAGGKYFRALTRSDGDQLAALVPFLESNQIKPVIDRRFNFEQTISALEYVKKGRSKGKVVIEIKKTKQI